MDMICQFSFKNFKSYRDETVFDLQATALPEFADTLIDSPKANNLLPVSVVYGPNGGGKTNLLQALACLTSTVVRPIVDLKTTRSSIILQQSVDAAPYLLDHTSKAEPTEFLIYFRTEGNEFRYYLSIAEDEIVSESLTRKGLGSKKPALIFERDHGAVKLGASINKRSINTSVNGKIPYLSFLAINYDIPVIAEVQKWFESVIIRNYADPHAEHRIMFSGNTDIQRQIIRFLNDMDIDISGYRYDKESEQLYIIRSIHGENFELPFPEESEGTKKLIAALPVIMIALLEGRPVIIDELDAKLHPKLLRYIISLFKNKRVNQKGAQLIFTSHDMTTLKNTVFRRDEIWFAALNGTHSSEIYCLYEIRRENNERINNTAAYDKQYLEGRYGADPYLQNMLTGGEWK